MSRWRRAVVARAIVLGALGAGGAAVVLGAGSASMAGAGVLLEGPLARGRGAWVLSARRSFLDLIADAIGTGGVVPEYSNAGSTTCAPVTTSLGCAAATPSTLLSVRRTGRTTANCRSILTIRPRWSTRTPGCLDRKSVV